MVIDNLIIYFKQYGYYHIITLHISISNLIFTLYLVINPMKN